MSALTICALQTIEESSFETLEALAEELAGRVIKYYIYAKKHLKQTMRDAAGVWVRIEKPAAILDADFPAVEVYRSAEPLEPYGRKMIAELGNKRPHIPFPLEGRLNDCLQLWKQD